MVWENVPLSRYAQRLKIVQDAVAANSELGDEVARKIAVQVLDAFDRIPEKVR
jgi:Family of unknown function (DUF6307)